MKDNYLTKSILALAAGILFFCQSLSAQHSVARQWNEVLLNAIRGDFARPTVHARNLFHVSVALYDSWAVHQPGASTYFLGKNVHGFAWAFDGVTSPSDPISASEETMSYAAYRLITYRFRLSPGSFETQMACDSLMEELGYDPGFTSTEYKTDNPAALGNYLAEGIIEYGKQDGSNEQAQYGNLFYEPINPPLAPADPGNPDILDPNRWQPLQLDIFIDQSGNPVTSDGLPFLSPEWGYVQPFAMTEHDLAIRERDGDSYWIYHDPGIPPFINDEADDAPSEWYRWGFELVGIWSSHLDPSDSVMWDISPGRIGNNHPYPESFESYPSFYNLADGGDASRGHVLNPATGAPYEPNIVPRADYARVLAEFWADGPDSETPPGHWFSIHNYVVDHPDFVPQYGGSGPLLDHLEWDVKAYFTLGGAMHDAAISAWSIKGYYDYLRPVSALRWMADQGQRTDPAAPNYHPQGLTLIPGLIEQVSETDPLAGDSLAHVGKIKINAWRGPDYIDSAAIDMAGVGWILVENWWPYQRPTFVTPPFAGYISGHSTFSRAAAEIMTLLTGDPFFPGGMGEFLAKENEFLVFEEGPSQDVVLQWATYVDASDQTSLSRIWGGIHPPADDIPGRIIGRKVGQNAFELAQRYFTGSAGRVAFPVTTISPNPAGPGSDIQLGINQAYTTLSIDILSSDGKLVFHSSIPESGPFVQVSLSPKIEEPGLYIVRVLADGWSSVSKLVITGE